MATTHPKPMSQKSLDKAVASLTDVLAIQFGLPASTLHVETWDYHYGGVRIANIAYTQKGSRGTSKGWVYFRDSARFDKNDAKTAMLILACEEYLVGHIYGNVENMLDEALEAIKEWFKTDAETKVE